MKSIPADAEAASPAEVLAQASPLPHALERQSLWIRRLIRLAACVAAVWAVAFGVSLLIQHTRLKGRLTARIATALGRPVEVGSYDLVLWGGPALQAQSISVAEDPRFGQEYFLRAESVSLRLRWRSLLAGHFSIDTVSLVHPSLNLVLEGSGDWNLAEWLPRPTAGLSSGAPSAGAPYPVPRSPSVGFRRIEVDGGRINFKRGDDKLPLALVGLTGAADTDASGRWRIDLTAAPWRAAVPVQQAGVLHVSGYVGGTSSRLRPAKLDVSWSDASLSDVLRLARADDYGIRGTLAATMSAATHDRDDAWTVNTRVQLAQIHRWDLGLRPDNPAANVVFQAEWHPADSSLNLDPVVIEAPHSSARLSVRISWAPEPRISTKPLPPAFRADLSGSQIEMGDLLSWVRAFRTGIADDTAVRGMATMSGVVDGWPLRVENADVSSDGVTLLPTSLRPVAHLGAIRLRYDRNLLSVPPVEISFGNGTAANLLHFESSVKAGRGVSRTTHVSGSLSEVRDLLASASALGWQLGRGADIAGPVRGDLHWQGSGYPWQAPAVGFIEWGMSAGAGSLRAPFLNLPIDQIRARVDLKAGSRHVTLASAQAFGAHWIGTLDRNEGQGGADSAWQFVLSGDRLVAAELDRWLNPRWRQSFINRMFPFLNSRPAIASAAPENLRAAGRLNLAAFSLGSLSLNHLQGNLRIDGRALDLQNAAAQFGGGAVTGTFAAHLDPVPGYAAEINLSRVDLSSVIDPNPAFAGLFDGVASMQASFDARGATRADLFASLDCHGNAEVSRAVLRKIDLVSSLNNGILHSGSTHLADASADFSCAQQVLRLENISLKGLDSAAAPAAGLMGDGTVDFNRNLSIDLRPSGSNAESYRLTGTLTAPGIVVVHAGPPRRSR